MLPNLLPFTLFALVATLTPGPTNLLILGHGAHFGLRATLPLVLAACLAAAAIVLMVGLGLGEVLLRYPRVQEVMSWLGVLWLSWLAWQLWRAAGEPLQAARQRNLGAAGAALLQVVNPKVWLMAVAVIGVFAGHQDNSARVLQLSLIFLLMALPCMTVWALLGVGSARWLQSPQRLRRFNQLLALLLLASAWMAMVL
ncbi:Homoserine/homoserine lactone efflux protein [Pseudomonas fluorescens]|uniref:LysE family translocator n=1 Tax=Pseudomonas fluorescens TaxID=294 RepID=UPI001255864A|nr:LysE family translocator [Pseudomonas fluorescens]CAG8863810.1 Homoserine/homoserine lactone efflux protein [Pseudomonas fluorescens]VVP69871.1 Homoserine/homoserine lactone efflux protein [Pseudomonas fluorescens]